MLPFFQKKKTASGGYDRERQTPVIRCSICNGEQVAGFRDLRTGAFTEEMLIKSPADLEQFKQKYGLEDVPKEY